MKIYLIILILLVLASLFNHKLAFKPFGHKETLPLRGFLALCIVLHHTSLHWGKEAESFSLFYYFSSMGGPVVAVFFFLTGYGLCVSLNQKGCSYIDGFLKKRFLSFVPEFLLLSLVVMFFSFFALDKSIISQLVSLVKYGTTPLPSSWFLYELVFVYIAFYFSAKVANCNLLHTGIFFTMILFLFGVTLYACHFHEWWFISLPAISFGYFGAYFEFVNRKVFHLHPRPYMALLCALLFLGLVFANQRPYYHAIGINIGAIAVYFCVKRFGFPQWKWLVFLGGISLYIYIIHGIVMRCTPRYLNGYIAYFIIVGTTIMLSVVLKLAREKIEKILKSRN